MKNFNFSAKDYTLRDVIWSNDTFRIPRYQRPYSWELGKAEELWEDIFVNADTFFLGSFIFNRDKEDKRVEVIDGQQRIITITIICAVLRDIAKQLGLEVAKSIQDNCIQGSFLGSDLKLMCGDSINNFFNRYIQTYPKIDFPEEKSLSKEEKLVVKNYEYFKKEINEYIGNSPEKEKAILEIIDILGDLKIIKIEITDENYAYDIFETVNARGTVLAPSDLLKNLVLKNVRDDGEKDSAKELWSDIEENTGDDIKQFVRYYWLSKHEFVTSKGLYKKIKEKIEDYDKFLESLYFFSDYYRLLTSAEKSDWSSFEDGDKIYHSLQGIHAMGITQCNVLFLSLLEHRKKLPVRLYKWFEMIENFSFNYFAIGKQPGNKIEKLYSQVAIDIWNAASETNEGRREKKLNLIYEDLKNKLRKELPVQESFSKNFGEIKYKNSESNRILLKYILSKLEKNIAGKELSLDFDEISIEHLLPQKPAAEWKLSRDDIRDYVDSIGNLTIISQTLNGKLGNEIMQKKVGLLRSSKISMTSNLSDYIEKNGFKWDREEIEKRVEDLKKEAFETWAIK